MLNFEQKSSHIPWLSQIRDEIKKNRDVIFLKGRQMRIFAQKQNVYRQ